MSDSVRTSVVGIQQGKIVDASENTFKVESYTQGEVRTRYIEAVNAYINEFEGTPPAENKYQYAIGDEVFYFMFPDGRGMILGKIKR